MNAARHTMDDPGDALPPGLGGDAWRADAADEAHADGLDTDPLHAEEADAWHDAAAPDVRAAAGPPDAADAQLAAWIEAIVDQDERALTALYDATIGRVFGLVQRIVRDTALAEEVVEDAYFQVWRQAARFDPARGRALTWLLAMARSRAIDALRREARFRHDPLDTDTAAAAADPAPAADELLELARNRSDLHQALMLLGAQPRQLVSMAFLRGLTHEEIAEQTQLPLGTVKSQIRRALQALRQILGRDETPVLAS